MIKKLAIFDFDHTLVFTPFKLDFVLAGKKHLLPKGEDYWETKQSLTILPVKPNQPVIDIFHQYKQDKDIVCIVMTGRSQHLKTQVNKILKQFDLKPDFLYLRPSGISILDYKKNMILCLAEIFGDVPIEMYEDRMNHAEEFELLGKEKSLNLTVHKLIHTKLMELYPEYMHHVTKKYTK